MPFLLILSLVFVFYAAVILAFTAGLARIRNRRTDVPGPVKIVSVVIPVRNEKENILRILEEMRGQDYPSRFLEVIVTDDYSVDGTMDLAAGYGRQHTGFPLAAVSPGTHADGEGGKKRALERAVGAARGEIILCTDADTVRGPGWVSSMAALFADPRLQMVLGPVFLEPAGNLLQNLQAVEFTGIMGTTAGSAALGYPVMCNGANLAYRRSAFEATGGYAAGRRFGSGDDQFLMGEVRKLYGRDSVRFNPDPAAVVTTAPVRTLAGFVSQRIRWVSKSRGYRDPAVIATGVVAGLLPLLILAGFAAGVFNPLPAVLALGFLAGKMLIDYPMVEWMIRFSGKGKLRAYYIPAQLFQLVYVVVIGIPGLFLTYRWKGRSRQR